MRLSSEYWLRQSQQKNGEKRLLPVLLLRSQRFSCAWACASKTPHPPEHLRQRAFENMPASAAMRARARALQRRILQSVYCTGLWPQPRGPAGHLEVGRGKAQEPRYARHKQGLEQQRRQQEAPRAAAHALRNVSVVSSRRARADHRAKARIACRGFFSFLNACTPPRTMRGPPGLLLAIMLGAAVAVPAATTCADYIRHGLEACARAYACSVPSHGRGPQATGDSTALCRAHSVWASLSELNCRHLPACPRRQDGRSHTRCGAKCCCGANAGGGRAVGRLMAAAVDLCACQARALRSGSKSTSAPGRSKPVTASALTCQDTPKPCS